MDFENQRIHYKQKENSFAKFNTPWKFWENFAHRIYARELVAKHFLELDFWSSPAGLLSSPFLLILFLTFMF